MSRAVAGFARRYRNKVLELDFETQPSCKHCGRKMKVQARSKPHHVVGQRENYIIITVYRRCGNSMCIGSFEKPIAPENHHVLPYCEFDVEVQALICELRWKTHDEIVEILLQTHGISITNSSVGNILKLYEIGCSQKYKMDHVEKIKQNGGIILTVDAMEPLKGEPAVYMARDELTGLKLGAKHLPNKKQSTIEAFFRGVKATIDNELGVPVKAIVCDAQKEQLGALEAVFPGVSICLCGYHFYKNVLKAPLAENSTLMKTIRSMLRKMGVLKEYQYRMAEQGEQDGEASLVDDVLEMVSGLSNWTRKTRDPCFSGLELWDRVVDVLDLVHDMRGEVGTGIFTPGEERIISRIKKGLQACVDKTATVAGGLKRVKEYLAAIVSIIDADSESSEEGLRRLGALRDELEAAIAVTRCTQFERDFVEALGKYIDTKGERLFTYRDVVGAPLTNNNHELQHMSIKHQLRRIIGHSAASHYLLAHGERIMFVDPSETFEGIKDILRGMDQVAARKVIDSERKPRTSIAFIMHAAAKWKAKVAQLREKLAILKRAKPNTT